MVLLAVIIPEKIPSAVPKGVQRAFLGLRRLPDDYLVYYEPLINPVRPEFIILSPHLGLLVIEIRNWYPIHIRAVSKDEVSITDTNSRIEVNPKAHAQQFFTSIIERAKKHPLCSSLIKTEVNTRDLSFPTGSLLLLPNCTVEQLKSHPLGDLHDFFGRECTICRETLKTLEKWDMTDLIPFLRSCVYPHGKQIPLTCDQIHSLRAVIHPDIIIELPEYTEDMRKSGSTETLKILDCMQERKVYGFPSGHHIFFGPTGSGKTAITVCRARILHNRSEGNRILFLCYSSRLQSLLVKIFSSYPRVDVYTFEQWAYLSGMVRQENHDDPEDLQKFGSRFLQEIKARMKGFHVYDAVFIDEGNDFFPSWFQCAREALKNPDRSDLFIVFDGQRGFQCPGGMKWADIGIHAHGHITHQGIRLETKYRNTQEILMLARLFLLPEIEDEEEYKNLVLACDCSNRSGLKPLLVWNTSRAHQADYAVYLVQRLLGSLKSAQYLSGITPDDIAILYPYAEGHDKNIISSLIPNLERYCPVQWVSENLGTYDRINNPGIKVHDCHSINGYYYRVVMILFAENFERFFTDSEFFSYRKLFYCSLTRPLDYLTIQYTDRTDIIRKILASGYVDEFIGK